LGAALAASENSKVRKASVSKSFIRYLPGWDCKDSTAAYSSAAASTRKSGTNWYTEARTLQNQQQFEAGVE
jgi:hypothetical protein